MNAILRVKHPPILNEIHGKRCLVIEAHAGTGKTYTIEHLVVDLLVNPEQNYLIKDILIVTFTEKAARELRTRVRKMIETILHNPSPSCPEHEPHWVIDNAARTRLQLALFAFEEAQISTIHGFCQRVIRDTAFFSGASIERKLASTQPIFEKAFAQLLREQFAKDPVLKTYLGVWLEDDTLANLKSLLLNALSCNALKPGLLKEVKLSTQFLQLDFSSACEKYYNAILANRNNFPSHANRAFRNLVCSFFLLPQAKVNGNSGADAYFQKLEDFQNSETCFWTNSGFNLEALLHFVKRNTANTKKLLHEISTIKETLYEKSPQEFEAIVPKLEPHLENFAKHFPSFKNIVLEAFLPLIHARVERIKNEVGVFDFEDLLTGVETSLRDNNNGVCALLRERYKLALIDEFQDTDPVQWAIFKTIFADSEAHRLLVVGDPKQSIYRFRGADVQTYLHATQKLPSLQLTKNFRSTQKIIDAYNLVLSDKGSFFQNGDIHYKMPVECGDKSAKITSEDGIEIEKPVKLIHLQPPSNGVWKAGAYKQNLLRFIASEIQNLLKRVPPRITSHKCTEGRCLGASDIFVLTSSNSEAATVARYLRRSGIPCTTFQNGSVFASPEAQEVMCLLNAVAEPNNRAVVSRACLGPFFEARLESVENILAAENTEPWTSLRRWHELSKHENISRLLETILQETGLLRREITTSESERTVTNILHIFEILQRWHTMENANFEECALRLKQATSEGSGDSETENMQRLETDDKAVQILTMHKSKGLEAAAVFFYGGFSSQNQKKPILVQDTKGNLVFDTREIPRNESHIEEQDLQENERILYVAITRVGGLLYLPFFEKILTGDGIPEFELNLTGRYRALAQRLHDLMGKRHSKGADADEKERFSKIAQLVQPQNERAQMDSNNTPIPQPPEQLLKNFSFSDSVFDISLTPNFGELRYEHAAPGARSYTSLKKISAAATRKFDEVESGFLPPDTADVPNLLPTGAAFGVCFHAAMEHLDLGSLALAQSAENWVDQKTTQEFLLRTLLTHGFSQDFVQPLATMIFNSALARCEVENIHFPSLAKAKNVLREIRFHMPWPEHAHNPEEFQFKAERGFLVGAIDVIAEHDGRFFVLDWKTDKLASYNQTCCEQHMHEHYHLQAQIYTLALMRLLGITQEHDYNARMGGHVYVFSRAPLAMAVGSRISWHAIQEFQERLKCARGFTMEREQTT